jgi:Leucine-rich repeat (LRR) protein
LDLNSNKLSCADLSELSNLEILNCAINELRSLNLTNCKKLKSLFCYKNPIEDIKGLKNLKKLEYLYCQCCLLKELKCDKLSELKELICFAQIPEPLLGKKYEGGLAILTIEGCKSLKKIDCAENNLKKLNVINHPELGILSCKENNLENLKVTNCPKLKNLDFSLQGLFERTENYPKEQVSSTHTTLSINVNSRSNIEVFLFEKDFKIIGKKNVTLTKNNFPKIKVFESSVGETTFFDKYLDKENAEEKYKELFKNDKDNKDYDLDKEISAANFKEPADIKLNKKKLTITNMKITGKLVIKD